MKKLIFFLMTLFFLFQFIDVYSEEDGSTVTNDTILEKATFAGGCFWCMQPPFDKLDGVLLTTVGYTGGPGERRSFFLHMSTKEKSSGERKRNINTI